jgi:hypothetical protein
MPSHTRLAKVVLSAEIHAYSLVDTDIPPTLLRSLDLFAIKTRKNVSTTAHNQYIAYFNTILEEQAQRDLPGNSESRQWSNQETGKSINNPY